MAMLSQCRRASRGGGGGGWWGDHAGHRRTTRSKRYGPYKIINPRPRAAEPGCGRRCRRRNQRDLAVFNECRAGCGSAGPRGKSPRTRRGAGTRSTGGCGISRARAEPRAGLRDQDGRSPRCVCSLRGRAERCCFQTGGTLALTSILTVPPTTARLFLLTRRHSQLSRA